MLCVGVPEPEVTVCKDGTPVQADGSRITLSHVDRQVLVQVNETTVDDTGEYTVTAVNDYGKVQHAVTVVVVPAGLEYVYLTLMTSCCHFLLILVTVLNIEITTKMHLLCLSSRSYL